MPSDAAISAANEWNNHLRVWGDSDMTDYQREKFMALFDSWADWRESQKALDNRSESE